MKIKTLYRCSECGYETAKWIGRCTNCGAWNTLSEVVINTNKNGAGRASPQSKKSVRLFEVISGNSDRIISNINEFNRVMGGGIVKDSVTIITARPGAGKSTLLLQVAQDLAYCGYRVLYASGEESDSQIKKRADRLFQNISENVWVYSDTSMDNTISTILEIDPDLVIIDSIQTFSLEAFPSSRAG